MNFFSSMDLILLSVTAYVGFYYLALFAFKSDDKTNLYFSLLCFAMALLDLMTMGLYMCGSMHAGILWQKGQFFASAFIAIGFLLFTFSLLGIKSTALQKALIILFALIILGGIVFDRHIIDASRPNIRGVTVFNIPLVYFEAKLGPLFNGLVLVIWGGMIYVLGILLKAYFHEKKRYLLPFIISFAVFFASAFIDTLVSANVILFLYTAEYSFFIMIIVMDLTLQKRFIGAFKEVETLNLELEEKVLHRTSEIQKMADMLSDANKTLEEKNTILAQLAERDGMTKLLNHVAFHARASELLSLSRRQNFSIGIIIMDIDYFKNINDTYGHQTGDRIIVMVADILRRHSRAYDIKSRYGDDAALAILREYDAVGRYGGDEFAIALPFCGLQETKTIADRICEKIRALSLPEHPDIHVTASLGCAVLLHPAVCETELKLIRLADQALYEAKKQGRNQSVIYTLE